MIGGAVGNGNTRQVSLFSGNIFNPQFSLFGDNYSNNTAISNVSMFNGNFSNNSIDGQRRLRPIRCFVRQRQYQSDRGRHYQHHQPAVLLPRQELEQQQRHHELLGRQWQLEQQSRVDERQQRQRRRCERQRQHRPDRLGARQHHQRAVPSGYLVPWEASSRSPSPMSSTRGRRGRGHEYHEYLDSPGCLFPRAWRSTSSREMPSSRARMPVSPVPRPRTRATAGNAIVLVRSAMSSSRSRTRSNEPGTLSTKRSGSTSPRQAQANHHRVSPTAATRPALTARIGG